MIISGKVFVVVNMRVHTRRYGKQVFLQAKSAQVPTAVEGAKAQVDDRMREDQEIDARPLLFYAHNACH
jgi:hypothetical protein